MVQGQNCDLAILKCGNLSDGQSAALFRDRRSIKWPVKRLMACKTNLVCEKGD